MVGLIGERNMAEKNLLVESDAVHIGHKNLCVPVTGFAKADINEFGTTGEVVFIPTGSPQALINLLKV